MKIEQNIFPFSLDESIVNRIDEFILPLKEFGITHFGHIRFFKDKTVYRIANNIEWTHVFFRNKFYNNIDLSYFPNIPFDQFHYRILFGAPPTLHDKALCEFGLWNFLLVYKKNIMHYDYWFFAGSLADTHLIEFYLNNLDCIGAFISSFQMNNQNIYAHINKKQKFLLDDDPPFFLEKSSSKSFINTIELAKIKNNLVPLNFSKRELECLFYLKKGRSMKEVAKYLGISSRTVETHINNMKEKMGCNTKSKLIDTCEFIYLDKKN